MEEAIKKLILNTEIKGEHIPHFPKEGYTPIPISPNNFNEILNIDKTPQIAFIDGGNQEILGSSTFSLQLIKIYYCIYQDNKRIKRKTIETFALIDTTSFDGSMKYTLEFFNNISNNPNNNYSQSQFDAYDDSLSFGKNRVTPSSIADAARRFMEINTAKKLCEELNRGFIVLDGNLDPTVTGESEKLNSLFETALKNNNSICGLSKTTSLITNAGKSIPAVLDNLKNEGKWYYTNLIKIKENKFPDIIVVKLHQNSKYIFRLDIKNKQEIKTLMSTLSKNSKDPVFLGYPYGLIEADNFARVSNREIDIIRTQILTKLGSDIKKIRPHLNTANAHSILDNIQ